MRFPLSFALLVSVALPALAQPKEGKQPKLPNLPPDLMAPTDPLSPADERKQFTLPPGFDAQLVASEPDIQKPMQMAFDAKGRLWVTTSYHYPFAAKEKPTDKLFVLSDFDPQTGKARKVNTFTSDLNIPIGVLPLPDGKSVIVSSVGEIRKYKIKDADGGPKSDGFEVLFKGFGTRDTHGMYNSYTLMPDGWVYACHGFSNDSTVKDKSGNEVKMQSGHTFRFRPDGSHIEVWTRGQVNPFGMTVDPWFNLYTADCHSKPITQLIPGAYYDSFGKPHDGLGFAPHVTAHSHNSTGLCGLAWYDADQFPKDYLGTMFVGNVVTNRINFDKIEWKGATPVAKELPDFLVSKDRWFRPVDIKLGPDGALYVADFYNKIIGHYEVDLKDPRRDKDRGRIWRIVWKGLKDPAPAPKFAYSDLTTAKGEVIDELLGHPNLMVRLQATNQAIHRPEDMKARKDDSDVYNAHRMWVDEMRSWRKGNPGEGIRKAYESDHPLLTSHQYRIERAVEELLRERKSRPVMARKKVDLAKSDPHVARAAVEMMAGNPKAEYIAPLLTVLKECAADDTHLRYAARVALRNCLTAQGGWKAAGDLVDADVKQLRPLAQAALGVRAKPAAEFLGAQFDYGKYKLKRHEATGMPFDEYLEVVDHIGRYGTVTEYRKVIESGFGSRAIVQEQIEPALQTAVRLVRAIEAAFGKTGGTLHDDTRQLIEAALGEKAETKHAVLAVQLLGALLDTSSGTEYQFLQKHYQKQLAYWMSRAKTPADLRAEAFEVAVKHMLNDMLGPIGKVLADEAAPGALRDKILPALAANPKALAVSGIRDGIRRAAKAASYRTASALALNLAASKAGTDLLLEAVKASDISPRVLQEKPILERLRGHKLADLDKRVADLTKNLPPADQRIAGLLKTRAAGFAKAAPDKEKGAKLFTQHCAACHKIGDAGGKIAPQLDGVGVRGVERLMEDILDPNRNVDAAFRARSITLKSEKTLTALMLRVEGKVLVVADLEGKEQRIPLDEIETNRETMLSAMPANFADVIPEADLYHILAYLLEQKAKEPPKK